MLLNFCNLLYSRLYVNTLSPVSFTRGWLPTEREDEKKQTWTWNKGRVRRREWKESPVFRRSGLREVLSTMETVSVFPLSLRRYRRQPRSFFGGTDTGPLSSYCGVDQWNTYRQDVIVFESPVGGLTSDFTTMYFGSQRYWLERSTLLL